MFRRLQQINPQMVHRLAQRLFFVVNKVGRDSDMLRHTERNSDMLRHSERNSDMLRHSERNSDMPQLVGERKDMHRHSERNSDMPLLLLIFN
jgi:hypothetical protein